MNNPYKKANTAETASISYVVERVYLGKYTAEEAIRRIVRAKIEQYRGR